MAPLLEDRRSAPRHDRINASGIVSRQIGSHKNGLRRKHKIRQILVFTTYVMDLNFYPICSKMDTDLRTRPSATRQSYAAVLPSLTDPFSH